MKTNTHDIIFGYEDQICAADDAAAASFNDFVVVVVDDADEIVKAYTAGDLTELQAIRRIATGYMIEHDFIETRVYLRRIYATGDSMFVYLDNDINDWLVD